MPEVYVQPWAEAHPEDVANVASAGGAKDAKNIVEGPWQKYKKEAPVDSATPPTEGSDAGATSDATPWEKYKKEPDKQDNQDAQPDFIDEFTGAPWAVRIELAHADNPKEAELAMKRNFGAGNYGQDKSGNWWYKTESGQKVAVRPGGWSGYFGNLATDLMASSSVMEGATAGFAAGEMVFPAGGGVIGAGLGAAGGKVLDDAVKLWRGTYDQKATELASHIANEGALNTGLVGGGQIAAKTLKMGANLLRSWMGTTAETKTVGARIAAPRIVEGKIQRQGWVPELSDIAPEAKIAKQETLLDRLSRSGASPPVSSLAPKAKALDYERVLRNMLTGDPTTERNTVYLLGRFRQMLKSSGIPDKEAELMMKQATERMVALSQQEVSESVLREMDQKIAGVLGHITAARNTATKALDAQESILRAWANSTEPRTSQAVADAVIASRRAFSQLFKTQYAEISKMAGGAKIISISPIKDAAKRIVDITPPNAVPPILKKLAEADAQEMLSLDEAHELRTALREMLDTPNLTPGPQWSMVSRVEDSVDAAIQDLAASGEGLPKAAAEQLKKTDTAYAQGIAKYKDIMFNKLVRDVKSGLVPDPEMVANTILKEGRTEAAKEIISLLKPEVVENIAKADMKNIIESVSRLNKEGQMTIDGPRLLSVLHDRMDMMKLVYKPEFLNDLAHQATELAALDGKIDVNRIKSFSSEGMKQALTEAINTQKQFDFAIQSNPLRALLTGSPQAADRAIETLIRPKDEAMTEAARNLLGPESPAWQKVIRYAQTKLLKSAIFYTPSMDRRVVGKAIEDELGAYTKRQQELLFPDGMAEDIKEIATEARYLFPAAAQEFGGSLAAATIKQHIPFSRKQNIKYAVQVVLGWVIDHPYMTRFLADQMRRNPSQARVAFGALSRWIINAKTAGPGRGQPQ